MIRCNLSTLMGAKKLKISDVCNETGLNRTTVTNLYYEKTVRVELEAIEKLCEFFSCKVGDLLEYVDDK
jgi:putative transcriptional regulator